MLKIQQQKSDKIIKSRYRSLSCELIFQNKLFIDPKLNVLVSRGTFKQESK